MTKDCKKYIAERFKELADEERERLSEWLEDNETEILEDIVGILLAKTVTKVKFVFPKNYNKHMASVYHEVVDSDEGIIEISGVHCNTAKVLYNWLAERFGEENVQLSSWYNSGSNTEIILGDLDKVIPLK